ASTRTGPRIPASTTTGLRRPASARGPVRWRPPWRSSRTARSWWRGTRAPPMRTMTSPWRASRRTAASTRASALRATSPPTSAGGRSMYRGCDPEGRQDRGGGSSSDGTATLQTLARYLKNGQLDSSFNADGWLITDFGGTDNAAAVAIQPDGKILVAGDTEGGSQQVAVARYLAR